MTDSFVHLKVHTEYSIADGLLKVQELVDRAVALKHARGRADGSVESVWL